MFKDLGLEHPCILGRVHMCTRALEATVLVEHYQLLVPSSFGVD